ncbi:hypothetical protein [Lysobacter sp. HA35]
MNAIAGAIPKGFFRRCWSGETKLWQAYWLVGVAGQLAALLICFAVTYPFWCGPQDNWWSDGLSGVVLISYAVYASVSIWRCAPNASSGIWSALARAVLVLSLAAAALGLWRAR